jgi:hypothetical protein
VSPTDTKSEANGYFELSGNQQDGQQKVGLVKTSQKTEMVRGTGFVVTFAGALFSKFPCKTATSPQLKGGRRTSPLSRRTTQTDTLGADWVASSWRMG